MSTESWTTCTELFFLQHDNVHFVLSFPILLVDLWLLYRSVSHSVSYFQIVSEDFQLHLYWSGALGLTSNILAHQLHFMTSTAHRSKTCDPG